jgi:hypothetical protein
VGLGRLENIMTNSKRTAEAIVAHALGVKPEPDVHAEPIRPVLSLIERKAFQAAWRIDREPVPETLNALACRSSRHARYIEHMARIIQEEMGR